MMLFRWEFRKLLVKRFTVILLALLFLSFSFACIDIFKENRIYLKKDADTATEVHRGLDGIRWSREHSIPFSGRVVDDDFVREARAYLKETFPDSHALHIELRAVVGNFTSIKLLLPGDRFYREDGTVVVANHMEEVVETLPVSEVLGEGKFVYTYGEGWNRIIDFIGVMGAPAAAVGIFLCATLYSGEYSAGTDAVLLTAKRGKRKLGRAKFFFGMFFPAALVTLVFAVYALIIFSVYGFSGGAGSAVLNAFHGGSLSMPDRMLQGFLPKDVGVTYLGYTMRTYLSVLLMTMICSAVSLLISSLTRSAVLSLGISAAVLLVPSVIVSNLMIDEKYIDTLGILNAYLPLGALTNPVKNWILMQIPLGDGHIPYVPMLFCICVLVVIPSYFIAVRAYAKHQVA